MFYLIAAQPALPNQIAWMIGPAINIQVHLPLPLVTRDEARLDLPHLELRVAFIILKPILGENNSATSILWPFLETPASWI